ncbi:MAG: DJ-1 family glyoxalase III [Lachnospiraceae bacterium]|jgi:4-methyl-5(b-hydroxyethyl)-thiazole monophosphate biosynthesis|nr:DJ-1 family glyoxalase III [Lachnospiraceae bacterium]MEE3460853.1 DJ-1 family glyoxalase III [Lachnospiraceae bacterium]
MADAYIFLAQGHEEVEMLTEVDLLRRAGLDIQMISITGNRQVTGSHNITMLADKLFDDLDDDDFDQTRAIILPGGMPGTLNLKAFEPLGRRLHEFNKVGKLIAAVCAAPTVLGHYGILKDKKATCYPGKEPELNCREYVKTPVCRDDNIITSRGLGTCIDFSLEIISALDSPEKADTIARKIVYKDNYD